LFLSELQYDICGGVLNLGLPLASSSNCSSGSSVVIVVVGTEPSKNVDSKIASVRIPFF
jgi:hypothetical protein